MKKKIKNIYQLTPIQQGILYHSIKSEAYDSYFQQAVFDVEGELNTEIVEKSINLLVQRHDILRTNFIYGKTSQLLQVVIDDVHCSVNYHDFTVFHKCNMEIEFTKFLKKDQLRKFDITKDTLFRVSIILVDDHTYKLLLSFHHIILDGWCFGRILKELLTIYSQLITNQKVILIPCTPFYKYVEWILKQNKEDASIFWSNYLSEYDNNTSFPIQNSVSGSDKELFSSYSFSLSINQTLILKEVALKNQVTINTLFLAIWGIVLQRLNNTEDVVFGSVVSVRPPDIRGIEDMIGIFINTIPVRVKTERNKGFNTILNDLKCFELDSLPHQFLSLSEAIKSTNQKSDIIDHIVVFQNYPIKNYYEEMNDYEKLRFKINNFEYYDQTNYSFNVIVSVDKALNIKFAYDSSKFSKSILVLLQSILTNIVESILANPEVLVEDLKILSEDENRKLLNEYNNTHVDYTYKLLHEVFEVQASKTPNNTALIYEQKSLTYDEVNKKANSLARKLRNIGIERENLVCLIINRSFEMVIGILAVLKAGGAYVPIDPDYPFERIRYIINDCNAKIVLSEKKIIEKVKYSGAFIDLSSNEIYNNESSNLNRINNVTDLAYIIYTSGTTGYPKGVMIEHKAIFNRIQWMQDTFSLTENDSILHKTPYTFDVSVWELTLWFFCGAKMQILPPGSEKNVQIVHRYLSNMDVSIVHFVPSMLRAFIEYLSITNERVEYPHLRFVFSSGEALSDSLVKHFYEITNNELLELYNLYGPTEATVDVTSYRCSNNTPVYIGKPINNNRAYILDDYNRVQPPLVSGELCISGVGLARGYINNNDLTDSKFVSIPHLCDERIYRTGDLARWTSEGEIEYLGRKDEQLKIRGIRVEIGEIEYHLNQYGEFNELVIIVSTKKNHEKSLVVFYTSDYIIPQNDIINYLNSKLPRYMIPKEYVKLDTFPILENGKVDKKSLAQMCISSIEKIVEEDANTLELTLIDLWKELFGTNQINRRSDFFELGGHSILVITMEAKLIAMEVITDDYELFRIIDSASTIQELAAYIKRKRLENEKK